MQADVVILGSGSAGMTAAIVAAKSGLDVLLLEKTEYFGGTSALSGGGIWIPCNHIGERAGFSDSREAAQRYIAQVAGNHLQPEMIDAFLDNAAPMIAFMEENTEFKSGLMPGGLDTYLHLEGATRAGRMLAASDYDGRKLGHHLKRIRPPLREFNAPGGMMLDFTDIPHARAAARSFKSFAHIARMFGHHLLDRLRYGRGARLTMGNALTGRLLRAALEANVTLWENSRAIRLLREGGRVTGVVAERDGHEITIEARRGVILATGGFSANPEMRAKYIPHAENHISLVPDAIVGDGIGMAVAVGAVLEDRNVCNAAYVTASLLRKRDGGISKIPHFDLLKPGIIVVNKSGKRFGNETLGPLIQRMHETDSVLAYAICDSRFIKTYGLGPVLPGGIRLRRYVRSGYLKEAPTLAALGAAFGIDGAELERTVATMNGYARTGEDLDFHRGETENERIAGDPAQKPNPCLGPIDRPPYYAIEILPADLTTMVGLRVNPRGQVLDGESRPIGGLYACGLDMNSIWSGLVPANGCNHGPNMTFGYIIARQLAQAA